MHPAVAGRARRRRWLNCLLGFRDERVDGLHEREAVKIRVAGANAADTMLSHKNGGLGVVHEVARQQRHLAEYLSQYPTGGACT